MVIVGWKKIDILSLIMGKEYEYGNFSLSGKMKKIRKLKKVRKILIKVR